MNSGLCKISSTDYLFTNYIYIYIYIHPQRDYSSAQQPLSVARHARRYKPRPKSAQLYVRLMTHAEAKPANQRQLGN